MFEDWWIYILVFTVSFGMLFLFRMDLGPFNTILNILGFVGVAVHELSHYTLCVLLGVKVEWIYIRYRSRVTGHAAPHGAVKPEEYERQSFLQSLVVGIAPLFIHTWLIIACFDLIHISGFDDLVYVGIGFLIVSLFIGSAPSPADLRNAVRGFKRSPTYSLYQLALLGLSILTILIIFNMFAISIPIEFFQYIFQYILIAIGYFAYKYSLRGINNVYHNIHRSGRINLKLLIRKRHRPVKARKLGIEEPHW
jgi:hypothetical protein